MEIYAEIERRCRWPLNPTIPSRIRKSSPPKATPWNCTVLLTKGHRSSFQRVVISKEIGSGEKRFFSLIRMFLAVVRYGQTCRGRMRGEERRNQRIEKGREKTMSQVTTGNMVAVTAMISLWRESRTLDDGHVPPHNAPYTRQFMRRNVLNTFLPPTTCAIFFAAYGSSHHGRLYIKGNILNAVHLHCKYGCSRAILF